MKLKNLILVKTILHTLFWILLVATLILFYYSLRTDEHGFRANIYTLILFGVTYLDYYIYKKVKEKIEKEEDED